MRLPTLRSRTANGMAARFSSSTDRFTNEGLGFGLVTYRPQRTRSTSSVFVTLRGYFVLAIYDEAHEAGLSLLGGTRQTIHKGADLTASAPSLVSFSQTINHTI